MNNLLDQQAPLEPLSGSSPTTELSEPSNRAEPVSSEPWFPSVFDSSMLSAWKSCPALFRLGYLNHWKPKGDSVHLVAGKAFAKGLEVARRAFYTGQTEEWRPLVRVQPTDPKGLWMPIPAPQGDAETAVALGLKALLAEYGDFECPEDSAKSPSRMCGAFEFYFENYPLHEGELSPIRLAGGRRAIEYSFAHPLIHPITKDVILHPLSGDPILLCGRMDAILDHAGAPMICDEKTTSQLGPTWSRQWDLRGQFMGYSWGCREAGVKVAGAVIRGVSILKTKYETQQAIIFHPEWVIDRWYLETCETIIDIIRAFLDGRFKHNFGDSCSSYGGCGFRLVCSSQDESPWLDTYFERREWNPLLRTETKR